MLKPMKRLILARVEIVQHAFRKNALTSILAEPNEPGRGVSKEREERSKESE
jgi:hypothetical protein